MCGTTVYLHDAWAAGSNLAKRDWRRLTSGQVWYCRERQKAPRDECISAQGENYFLTSALEVYYSLNMWEKSTSTLSHRLVKPPRRCPNPILPQIGAISGATSPCRGRILPMPGSSGCCKALGTLVTSLHPNSYSFCSWFHRGDLSSGHSNWPRTSYLWTFVEVSHWMEVNFV